MVRLCERLAALLAHSAAPRSVRTSGSKRVRDGRDGLFGRLLDGWDRVRGLARRSTPRDRHDLRTLAPALRECSSPHAALARGAAAMARCGAIGASSLDSRPSSAVSATLLQPLSRFSSCLYNSERRTLTLAQPLAVDLLHPSKESEARKHKLSASLASAVSADDHQSAWYRSRTATVRRSRLSVVADPAQSAMSSALGASTSPLVRAPHLLPSLTSQSSATRKLSSSAARARLCTSCSLLDAIVLRCAGFAQPTAASHVPLSTSG